MESPVKYPFEALFEDIASDPAPYVDSVVSCLESEFLRLPKGPGFIEYPTFESGYEVLKRTTSRFADLSPDTVMKAVDERPIALIVLRCMLGFTPSELAYVASQECGEKISQTFARDLDRRVRMDPEAQISSSELTRRRLSHIIYAACRLLREGVPQTERVNIHRLQKADTEAGLDSLQSMADLGAPYAMVLYERFLGRPFAGHRDSVSELIGDTLETAIEDILTQAGISFRKTKRAERIGGFDQAPDFIIPSEFNPQVVIEAKITEDDGTARDKVTRIQHLHSLSIAGQPEGSPKYEVVACINGRGFRERREDMRKMLLATQGKVFTVRTLDNLVPCTRLREFATA